MSHGSCEDGLQTPETVTEYLKSIHLNDRESVDCAGDTNLKVKPMLALPSMFVWCLHCAVLVRIDFPIGHRIGKEICSCKAGESLFLSTVCLNCLELQKTGKKDHYNSLASRTKLVDSAHQAVYISPDCVEQSNAFEKAKSLTQISCKSLLTPIYGSHMLYHASIKELFNLCDVKCRLRTVVTDRGRTEDYESFWVAGFM
ncbi:hypothetical protein GcC1_134011 [Golovinomyces cichoracearum]|uniref:Uncharacterized protein n=1 Tax=Golovinomyces cichoracearum TaxID=62708 RepID=A0A420I306_9PEZI|nr:hypothetical protein GcC1_134011 [Golovinomyces cichoracearum]